MKLLNSPFKYIFIFITTKKILLLLWAALFTTIVFAQAPKAFAPVLGNAASFAVFGGNAGITNQGVNTITHGSIGTVAASIFVTGFHDGVTAAVYSETGTNVGNATGGIYTNVPAPGTASTFTFASLTLADASAAYNSISPAAQPGGIDPGAGELGGLTLTPGVYKAVTLNITNVDLTLDAQSDPNAVWVFQSTAALTVGIPGPTGARSIKMINGGLARNVFWYVGSSATINGAGGGVVTGTIISSASITFSTAGNAVQTVLNGRAISLNASVTMVNTTVNACDTWTGLTSNAWTTATNWSTGAVPVSTEEVLIPNVSTTQPVVNSSISSLYNLTLYTGSALTVTNTLQVSGFINNLGNNFNATSGTITFNGTIPQTIPANTFTNLNTVQNLIINNSIGVVLGGSGNINVSNLFTLSNGLLTTGNNILVINNNATTNGASTTKYVNGTIRKVGNQAFMFPVGMGGKYAPISISAPTNTSDHFTASYVANNPDPMYPTASLGAGLNKVSSTEYWQLNRTNGTSNVDVTLSFDGTRSGGISTLADLRVAGWNGTQWINQGNTNTTGNAGNNPSGTVKSNPALAVFGPFTIGSSTTSNTLPISLVSFSAQIQNNNIALAWETTNEIYASHFNIQRSTSGTDFSTVGKVNTINGGNYAFIDNILSITPTPSSIYYRLQMVDNNGSLTYSKTVAVTPNATNNTVRIFPDPVRETLFVQVTSTKSEKLTLQIIDLQFKLLQQQTQQVTAGTTSLSFNTAALAKGSYVLIVKGSTETQQKQFIKQ